MSRYILKDLVDFKNGYAFKSKFFSNTDGIPLIRIRDIKNSTTKTYYFGEYDNDFIVKNGDFLIGMDGNFEITQWKGKDSLLNQRVCTFKIKDNNLNEKYLYYFLKIKLKQIEDVTGYTTVKHLSINTLKNIVIEIPSLQEQEKIVARFDKIHENIDKSISNDLAKIKSLENYLSQELNKKFKDLNSLRNTTIGDKFNLANGGTPLKSNKNYYENGNIPFLITGDFKHKFIDKTAKHITKEGLDNSSAKIFPLNSVVVAMYGATAGKVGILKAECASNQAVCCLYPNDKYDEEFIYYFFLNFKEELVSLATGSAQPNISQQKISKFKFYELDLNEQIKISSQIKTIENLVHNYIDAINTKINKYSSFLKSTLNKEFSYE
jgi:type I restriction enzyme S subunit